MKKLFLLIYIGFFSSLFASCKISLDRFTSFQIATFEAQKHQRESAQNYLDFLAPLYENLRHLECNETASSFELFYAMHSFHFNECIKYIQVQASFLDNNPPHLKKNMSTLLNLCWATVRGALWYNGAVKIFLKNLKNGTTILKDQKPVSNLESEALRLMIEINHMTIATLKHCI